LAGHPKDPAGIDTSQLGFGVCPELANGRNVMTAHATSHWKGIAMGLAAAALFGASAPCSKLLLPGTGPLVLSSLLYLGAGLALCLVAPFRARHPSGGQEAPLRPADFGLLAGIILFGGILGPVAMLFGLQHTSAMAGSLLLNLEAPFTILIALLLFGEHLGHREKAAVGLIVLGAALLGKQPGEFSADWLGALAIAGACASWGLDNNLSQRLTLRDPIAVLRVKALGAGTCTAVLAWALGQPMPAPGAIGAALLLGSASYGLSLFCDMQALRLLGAAREAACFATAPFIGALLSVPLLGDRPTPATAGAVTLMLLGVCLLAREHHSHEHQHDPVEHEHSHVHDEHHDHEHQHEPHPHGLSGPHSHPHRHENVVHEHPHVSDLHHRHGHL
jgi:drug/metabolite transporter (DMT)-like permease